jgi:uncharacterized protein YodC (DUF2158 family)
MSLSVGDVVVLKSGSPKMTVESFRSSENGQIAVCRWFVEGTVSRADFFAETLRQHEQKPPPEFRPRTIA